MKDYLGILFVSLVAGFLMYIGKHEYFLCKLQEVGVIPVNRSIGKIQFWSFLTGFIWAGLYLPLKHSHQKNVNKKKTKVFQDLVKYNKDNIFKIISNQIGLPEHQLKTRIFKPEKGVKGFYNQFIHKKCVLKLIHMEGISDDFQHTTLKFEVSKKKGIIEGLVGKAYIQPGIHVDLDLSNNNYNITEAQRTKIGDIEFCSTVPVFDNDQTKVVAVVAVDSEKKLKFNEEQKKAWSSHMVRYAAFIDKHIKI